MENFFAICLASMDVYLCTIAKIDLFIIENTALIRGINMCRFRRYANYMSLSLFFYSVIVIAMAVLFFVIVGITQIRLNCLDSSEKSSFLTRCACAANSTKIDERSVTAFARPGNGRVSAVVNVTEQIYQELCGGDVWREEVPCYAEDCLFQEKYNTTRGRVAECSANCSRSVYTFEGYADLRDSVLVMRIVTAVIFCAAVIFGILFIYFFTSFVFYMRQLTFAPTILQLEAEMAEIASPDNVEARAV